MIILAVLITKILWRVETSEKKKHEQQISVFIFLPTAKYIGKYICAHKIKTIVIMKSAMTRVNVLAYTKPKK